MPFAFKVRRQRLVQTAGLWLAICIVGISTVLLHNRGMTTMQPMDFNATTASFLEDLSFAAPLVARTNHDTADKLSASPAFVASSSPRKEKEDEESLPSTSDSSPPLSTKTASKPATPSSQSTTTTNATLEQRCFPFNSQRWIQGDKETTLLGGSLLSPQELDVVMEGPLRFDKLHALFQETICHDDSPLKQVSNQASIELAQPSLSFLQRTEEWYQRFFYLAMHWKFHQPALPEYRARKQCQQEDSTQQSSQLQAFLQQHKIGDMDYECPDAKFIVSAIGHIGFGAFINTQVCMTILIALRTGRIPIFTAQSLYWWQRGKTDPWLLAPTHCDAKNLQCYYMPMTPCALLIEDIRNATKYGSDNKEQRWLRQKMNVPEEMKDDRIVAINSGLQSKGTETEEIRGIAADIVGELMEEWKKQRESNPSLFSDDEWKSMELAKQWMVDKTKDDPSGLLRQMYVYFLRFNPHYKKVLKERMSALVPPTMKAADAVGIAIRGSDKCNKESTCLPFPRYMELVSDVVYPTLEVATTQQESARPRLIMTTEDPNIFNESLAFQRNSSFPFQFLVNDQDNMQGSGFPKDFRDQGENTIVSTMTALQLHLSAGRVYLNCCSNFHAVIRNLLTAQCGAVRHGNVFVNNDTSLSDTAWQDTPPVAHCLNNADVVPRRYQICCGWYDKGDSVCNEIWTEHLQNRQDIVDKLKKRKAHRG